MHPVSQPCYANSREKYLTDDTEIGFPEGWMPTPSQHARWWVLWHLGSHCVLSSVSFAVLPTQLCRTVVIQKEEFFLGTTFVMPASVPRSSQAWSPIEKSKIEKWHLVYFRAGVCPVWCVYVFTYVFAHVCKSTHECRGERLTPGVFLNHCPFCFLKKKSLTESGTHWLG